VEADTTHFPGVVIYHRNLSIVVNPSFTYDNIVNTQSCSVPCDMISILGDFKMNSSIAQHLQAKKASIARTQVSAAASGIKKF
jgi:hypothetical protein